MMVCGVSFAPPKAALWCVCLPLCSEDQEAPKAICRAGSGTGPQRVTVPFLEIVAKMGCWGGDGRRAAGQTSVL